MPRTEKTTTVLYRQNKYGNK